jgi:hypothetical protein
MAKAAKTPPTKAAKRSTTSLPAKSTQARNAKSTKTAAPARAKSGTRKPITAQRSLVAGLRLLQIAPDGKPTDAAFEAYDIRKAVEKNPVQIPALPGSLPMLNAIRLAQHDQDLRAAKLWGLLPADFTERTQLTGIELEAAIADNPGYDFYYCSANPELEAVHHNAWRSPEITHPNFVGLSRAFLNAAGVGDAPVDAISHSALFATGNLIVATPEIWTQYTAFIDRLMAAAVANLDKAQANALFNEKPIRGRMTYLALLAARLPGVFLMMKQSNFKTLKIPLVKQERGLNPHLRVLREMKDIGLEQRSRWHLTSWMTYRGLYLAHVLGKAWVMKHIDSITPKTTLTAVPIPTFNTPYPRSFQADALL